MYENYFGFADLPFRVTPQPQFFYSNSTYREALATLRYGIEGRKGFIVITGEVGTGKTTLLKVLMRSGELVIHTAFVFNPNVEFTGLLRFVLEDLGVSTSVNDKYALLEQLNDYLIRKLQEGQIVALLLDEAQQLSDAVLEELRLLSNFETENEKLIQIVLVGQPELEQRINQPGLRQLKQRVALHCRLAPLKSFEIRRYIDLRLKTVGYKGNELFETKALERITFYSRGIPRLINVICDNALLITYAASTHKVSAEIIEEVAADLELSVAPGPDRRATNFNISQAPAALPFENCQRAAFRMLEQLSALYSIRTLPRPVIALLLMLLVAGGSAFFFQQSNETKEEQNSTGGKAQTFRAGRSVQSIDTQTALPSAIGKGDIAPAPPINEPTESPSSNSSVPQVAGSPIREPGVHTPDRSKLQRSEAPRYWPNDKPADVGSQRSPGKKQRFFRGHFEVVRNSIAFEKPTRNSALIATLRPGTWVRVEEKVGNYLHVRSLNDPWIQGYVHEEDAYFEYIGFAR
jgi:general secretion pathway protein A